MSLSIHALATTQGASLYATLPCTILSDCLKKDSFHRSLVDKDLSPSLVRLFQKDGENMNVRKLLWVRGHPCRSFWGRGSEKVGVLCTFDDALAEKFRWSFEAAGIPARVNEPYSGKEGIMFSVEVSD
jgi:hypothetical protein